MSVSSITPQVAPSTNAKEIVLTPNATADDAIVSGIWYISSIIIDNTLNSDPSWLKIADSSDATTGTTAPDIIIKAGAGETVRVFFTDSKPRFTTAISAWCVTAAGTAGAVSPSSTVTVKMTVHQ